MQRKFRVLTSRPAEWERTNREPKSIKQPTREDFYKIEDMIVALVEVCEDISFSEGKRYDQKKRRKMLKINFL